jgi:hypothetical protein
VVVVDHGHGGPRPCPGAAVAPVNIDPAGVELVEATTSGPDGDLVDNGGQDRAPLIESKLWPPLPRGPLYRVSCFGVGLTGQEGTRGVDPLFDRCTGSEVLGAA